MSDLLNSLFRILAPLGEMSLIATYAAAVVAILRLLLKKRAPKQVLCLLWLVVFVRLLVPVSLESPLSIVPDVEQVQIPSKLTGGGTASIQPPSAVQDHSPVQPEGTTANPTAQGNVEPDAVPLFPTLNLPEGETSNTQPQTPAPSPWQTLPAGIWLAGSALMGGYGLISYLHLRRRLFDAIRAQDGAWEHPSVNSPFILGVIRPKIYLPAGLYGQPRQFILCHERAHLRRLDHIIKPICWVALTVHWFNPAVWIAFILMSRDIESACDEAVIRQLGPKIKADYSATLLSLATNRRIPAPCPLAFDEGDAKGRIQNVLRYRRPTLWIVTVSVIMAAMVAVCLLTDPVSAQEPGPDPSPDPSAAQSQPPEGYGVLDPWMVEVLNGERRFTRGGDMETWSTEQFSINQLRDMVYMDEHPNLILELGKLAIMDLDRNGINEMVVWPRGGEPDDTTEIGYTVGYFIFYRQGDEVKVHYIGWRPMQNLKADGTFNWSSSAWNWGTSRLIDVDTFETENVTWRDTPTMDDEKYFVDGIKATKDEFEAAIAAQDAKPDPVWYVYEDGQLNYAPIRVPIPLDEHAQALSVPDFLDADQQLLYRQTYMMYRHLFGATSESADYWPGHPGSYGSIEPVDYNGSRYWPATGLYSMWSDFEEAVLSVFTQDFWKSKNEQATYTTYVSIDGTMHYLDWARGSGGYNENFPETFRLVEKTDDTISFIMTGYYSDSRPFFSSATNEEIAAWLAAGWESSIEFPMRMVRTERGWRFDEFHSARTDNGLLEFSAQMMPNPYAPPPPGTASNTPEPSPEPTAGAVPVVCEHGLDNTSYDYSSGHLVMRCELDGTAYPAPAVTQSGWQEGSSSDFDSDGRTECAFYAESGAVLVADVHDGQLYLHTFDPNSLLPGFNQNRTAQYVQDETGQMYLDVSYWGKTARIQLDSQYHLNHGRTPDPLAYSAYMASFTNGLLWCGANVDLSSVVLDHQQNLHCNWYVHYTGSGFQTDPDSFAFTISE